MKILHLQGTLKHTCLLQVIKTFNTVALDLL